MPRYSNNKVSSSDSDKASAGCPVDATSKGPESSSKQVIRFLRNRRCAAKKKRSSDAEQTIQLDSDYDLFAVNSDCSERGCMKVRSHMESLEQTPAHSDNERSSDESKKSVSFGTVGIHSHEILLGDNPSVSMGPPLTIHWTAFDTQTLSLDDYESAKPATSRRTKDAMLLPRMIREDWLRDSGYARGEIKGTVSAMEKIKQQRCQSARDGRWKKKVQRLVGLCE